MIVAFNTTAFRKDMKNIIDYSIGYVDGIQGGKKAFLSTLGIETVELMKEYIDSNARVNPEMLHHVYEWYQTGSPNARLYDIQYTASNVGLSFRSTFKQSTSIKNGSRVPFYDKARIMEQGIPVTIRPVRAQALAFEVDGEEIFTRQPVEVLNPGGTAVQGGFEKIFDSFFNRFFTQAFLRISGIANYLENPTSYKKNLNAGKKGGKAKGYETGYRWIANAGVIK
ncbi:MAG: hypothetical protein RLZZ196_1008 [Bacteroidota bacterium]|jgi:hypothetical protein